MFFNSKALSLEDKIDERVSWFVGIYFIASTANMTMKTVFPIPESLWSIVSLMWGVVIVFFMIRGLKTVVQRSKKLILHSILFLLALFFWSYILISQRNEPTRALVSDYAIPTFIFWLPVGIYACSIRKMQILYNVLIKTSYVLTFLLVLCFLFRNNGVIDGEEADAYNMFFGYSMAFASLFQLNEYYRTKENKLLLLFIFQIILILIYANRGALLSIAFFIFYKVILDQRSLVKKVLWMGTIIFAVVLYFIYAEVFAFAALHVLSSFDLQSRTLQKMAEATLIQSEARDELRNLAVRMIGDRPILGWGIGGECYTLGNKLYGVAYASHAFSPHNGILQHMLHFGVIFGNVINLLVIWPIFKIHKIKDEYRHGLILVACSAYFITTLWSSCDILLKPAVAIYVFLYYYYRYPKKIIR